MRYYNIPGLTWAPFGGRRQAAVVRTSSERKVQAKRLIECGLEPSSDTRDTP